MGVHKLKFIDLDSTSNISQLQKEDSDTNLAQPVPRSISRISDNSAAVSNLGVRGKIIIFRANTEERKSGGTILKIALFLVGLEPVQAGCPLSPRSQVSEAKEVSGIGGIYSLRSKNRRQEWIGRH